MKYAIIENGVCINLIIAAAEFAESIGAVETSPTANIGDTYADGVFTPAPIIVSVPAEITMRQARLVLLGAGLLTGVQPAIDALPSPQKEAAQIEWEYSNALRRDNVFVATLGPALGLTSAQIDQLFIQGARL